MTAHHPIQFAQIDDAARWREVCLYLQATMEAASQMNNVRPALSEALCGALEETCAGTPQMHTAFGSVREEAGWWADVASPIELEAYAGAALRRIKRANFATEARKRIFYMLWQTFTEEERGAFLKYANKQEG